MFPINLTDLYENATTPNKIHVIKTLCNVIHFNTLKTFYFYKKKYMIWSLRETLEKFNVSRHNDPELVKQKYIEELMTILKKDFLDRVSRDIETDLRLSIHLDLKSDESKMFKDSIKDLYKFINLQPIVIYDKYIDVRQHVKKYLEKTFYDLTTVALHDWKAYSEMRNLAYQKYNLSLVDPYLPSSTLEQVCFFL